MKFLYCLNPDDDKPILLINTHIGIMKDANGKEVIGVMGNEFTREIKELERLGKKEVELWINTQGGSVKEGWEIYGAIQNTKIRVTGLNIGIAASTGGWIFEGCHFRIMMDYALIMMHNPHGGSEQSQDEFTESIAIMLAARTKKTKEEIMKLMNATTFMNAETAEINGFCDEVRPSGTEIKNASPDIEWIWNEGNKFLNSILPPNPNKMKEVINFLNTLPGNKLADTADSATVLSAITKFKNDMDDKLKAMTEERDELKAKCDEMEKEPENSDEYNALKEKYDALNSAINKLTEEREKEKEDRAEEDCKNAIELGLKDGRIINTTEVLNYWKETGKKLGVETLKNLLNTLPVNKSMPFEHPNDVGTGTRDANAPAVDVAEFKNKFKGEYQG